MARQLLSPDNHRTELVRVLDLSQCIYVHACVCACVRVFVLVYVRVLYYVLHCVCTCVRACERACVRACVRVCVRACVRARVCIPADSHTIIMSIIGDHLVAYLYRITSTSCENGHIAAMQVTKQQS